MSDSQIPDLSSFSNPGELPAPRPASTYKQSSDDSTGDEISRRYGRATEGPGAIPPQHIASLQDSELQNKRRATRPPPASDIRAENNPEEEPFRGHSFLSHKDIEEQMTSQTNREQEAMPEQFSPSQPQSNKMSQPMNQQNPKPSYQEKEITARRDIRDLFKTGMLVQDIEVAGYKLTVKTLSNEEYTRAWAMASVFPEGNARDFAIRQYLLALSVTHINDTPTEQICAKNDVGTDPIVRRAYVFGNLANDLAAKFFDSGFIEIRNRAQQSLEQLNDKAGQYANFTHPTQ